jgi:transcription initiation factor TFIIB
MHQVTRAVQLVIRSVEEYPHAKESQTPVSCHPCATSEVKAPITDPNSGEVICSNCGRILSEGEEQNSKEWRDSGLDYNILRDRVGAPRTLARHDLGLSTIIGSLNKDASGKKLEPATRSMMNRVAMWDMRSQIRTSKGESLRPAFYQLAALRDKLGLPDSIIETTAYIYRKAQQKGLIHGSTINASLAAAAYTALRAAGTPRSLNEISEVSNVRRKEVARAYRRIISNLDLSVPALDPTKCVSRISNKAGLSETTKRVALDMLHYVIKTGEAAGKNPAALASSILYLASLRTGEDVSQEDIAVVAGITEVTVRVRVRDLRKKLLLDNLS